MRAALCIWFLVTQTVASAASDGPRMTRVGPAQIKPWESWHLERPKASPIDVYLSHDSERRPVVLMLPGSQCAPLFLRMGTGKQERLKSTLLFEELVESNPPPVHFAALDRRGIKSFAPLPSGPFPPSCTPESRDKNSPRESADLLAVELLRSDANRAVKYLILPGLDHGYWTGDEVWFGRDVMGSFLDWSLDPKRKRSVETWARPPRP